MIIRHGYRGQVTEDIVTHCRLYSLFNWRALLAICRPSGCTVVSGVVVVVVIVVGAYSLTALR